MAIIDRARERLVRRIVKLLGLAVLTQGGVGEAFVGLQTDVGRSLTEAVVGRDIALVGLSETGDETSFGAIVGFLVPLEEKGGDTFVITRDEVIRRPDAVGMHGEPVEHADLLAVLGDEFEEREGLVGVRIITCALGRGVVRVSGLGPTAADAVQRGFGDLYRTRLEIAMRAADGLMDAVDYGLEVLLHKTFDGRVVEKVARVAARTTVGVGRGENDIFCVVVGRQLRVLTHPLGDLQLHHLKHHAEIGGDEDHAFRLISNDEGARAQTGVDAGRLLIGLGKAHHADFGRGSGDIIDACPNQILSVLVIQPVENTETIESRGVSSGEALLGFKHDLSSQLALHGGVGTETRSGNSSPDWRVYVGLNYAFGFDESRSIDKVIKPKPKPRPKKGEPPPPPEPPKFMPEQEGPQETPGGDEVFALRGVNFAFDSATRVLPGTREILNKLGEHLKKTGFEKLIIEGHTDSVGSEEYNQNLGQGRANTIRSYLIRYGNFNPGSLEAKSYGEIKPIADNGNYQGRQLNRRVVFRIYYKH